MKKCYNINKNEKMEKWRKKEKNGREPHHSHPQLWELRYSTRWMNERVVPSTILVLHLFFYRGQEHVTPKLLRRQILLLGYLQLGYGTARLDQFLVLESIRSWNRTSERKHELVHTNCKRLCANPHHQLGNLCDAIVSKFPHPCSQHSLCPFADVLCCLCRPNFIGQVSQPASVSWRTSSSVKMTPASKFIHLFHSGRLVSLRAACTLGELLLLQHFLLLVFAHTSFSHLKKSIPLMFAMPLLEQMWDIL